MILFILIVISGIVSECVSAHKGEGKFFFEHRDVFKWIAIIVLGLWVATR